MVDEKGIYNYWKRAQCKFDGVHRSSLKMEDTRRSPKFRGKYTVRVDLRAWNIREEWATDKERWKGLCKTHFAARLIFSSQCSGHGPF